MRECKDCDYFCGYESDDGTPVCDYEGGFDHCPFCDAAKVKKSGCRIEIDSDFMDEYIRHTIMNTIHGEAKEIAEREVKRLITDDIKKEIQETMRNSVQAAVDEALTNFMEEKITIGNGWMEEQRTITRRQYFIELIEKEAKAKTKDGFFEDKAKKYVKEAIEKFNKGLCDDINASVRQIFSDTTRQTLTDSFVNMLMCNDTYKKLSESMNHFLTAGKSES